MAVTALESCSAAVHWLRQHATGTLRGDSRAVQAGDVFVAWPGYATDGRRFVEAAFSAGASACLIEAEGAEAFGFDEPRVATLPELKAATGIVADQWFGHPSGRLDVVATTGTNGKTSTAWWIAQALTALGRRCGVIGTLGIGEPPCGPVAEGGPPSDATPTIPLEFTGLTTPDPIRLHAALTDMADASFRACAIEASSIGIAEHRLASVSIAVALFTNFTQDHLDYHGTMAAYWDAKAQLFAWPGLRAAVLNVDDRKGAELVGVLAGHHLDLWTCAVQGDARLTARKVGYEEGGLAFDLHEGCIERKPLRVRTALIGEFNVSNLLGVIGSLRALGVSLADAVQSCSRLTPVPGRMQRVVQRNVDAAAADHPVVIVDYAHTPDALDKVLAALRPLAASRNGKLVCVFGCGGNRDATKRPLMGAVAQERAHRVVITSDNPRDEVPGDILRQIVAGLAHRVGVSVIEDRREAIALSLREARPEDVILIAGKGHEDYQEIAGVKHPFSDVVEAERALRERSTGAAQP